MLFRSVDNGEERHPDSDDVAAVDRPVGHDAVQGCHDHRFAQLSVHGGQTRLSIGERRLGEIVAKYGRREVNTYETHLLDYSERMMRAVLRPLGMGR